MQERDREEKCTDHSHKDRVPSNNHLCALFAILDRMPSRMRLSSGHLIIALVLYLAVAGFNAIFAFPQLPTWYAGLTKPAFLPVDTFPLVMVVLFTYLLLGCSVFFIWHASCMNRHDQLLCLTLIIFTIILTGLWGYLFFGLKSPLMGVMISGTSHVHAHCHHDTVSEGIFRCHAPPDCSCYPHVPDCVHKLPDRTV